MPNPSLARPGRGAVADLLVANQAALGRAPRLAAPQLRGTQPREPTEPPNLRFYADLTDPSVRPFMITPADPAGRTAYIDEYPASNLGVRTTPGELKTKILGMLAGAPMDRGPRVTFVNDDPTKPSPRVPLDADTAGMVAAAVIDSGLRSVNINSTTGGHEKNPRSAHHLGQAVDFNRVNGLNVGYQRPDGTRYRNSDPAAVSASDTLQAALQRQPDIYEDYGPAFLHRMPGPQTVASAFLANMHQNHVHGATRPIR